MEIVTHAGVDFQLVGGVLVCTAGGIDVVRAQTSAEAVYSYTVDESNPVGESNAYQLLSNNLATCDTSYDVQFAETFAHAMDALATAHPSPWADREAELANAMAETAADRAFLEWTNRTDDSAAMKDREVAEALAAKTQAEAEAMAHAASTWLAAGAHYAAACVKATADKALATLGLYRADVPELPEAPEQTTPCAPTGVYQTKWFRPGLNLVGGVGTEVSRFGGDFLRRGLLVEYPVYWLCIRPFGVTPHLQGRFACDLSHVPNMFQWVSWIDEKYEADEWGFAKTLQWSKDEWLEKLEGFQSPPYFERMTKMKTRPEDLESRARDTLRQDPPAEGSSSTGKGTQLPTQPVAPQGSGGPAPATLPRAPEIAAPAADPISPNRSSQAVRDAAAAGQTVSYADAEGNTSLLTYDEYGRLVKLVDGSGNATEWTFNDRGLIAEETNAFGTRVLTYDDAGNLVRVEDHNGRAVEYAYEPDNVNLLASETWFDAQDVEVQTIQYDYTYHATEGWLTQLVVTDVDATYVYQYNADGQVTQVQMGPSALLDYDFTSVTPAAYPPYNQSGTVQTLTDPNRIELTGTLWQCVPIEFGSPAQQTYEITPDTVLTFSFWTGETSAEFYGMGLDDDAVFNESDVEVLFTLLGWGVSSSSVNDEFNGLYTTQGTWVDYTIPIGDYLSGDVGYLTFVGSSNFFTPHCAFRNVSLFEDPDANGQPDAAPNVVLDYEYDPATGNLLTVTDSYGGLTEYHYDAAGVLESITQTEAEGATGVVLDKRVDFEFNPLGQAQAIRRYASLDTSAPVAETAYDYDPAGRLASLVHKASAAGSAGATLANYAWTYDANGRIKTFDSPDGLRDYTYDRSGQLTDVALDDVADEHYEYDDSGNRTTSGVTGSTVTYATGDDNRLESVKDGTDVYAYEYDNEGNTIARYVDGMSPETANGELDADDTDITIYAWDHRNRLTSATSYATYEDYAATTPVPSRVVQHTYNYLNQWVATSVDLDGAGTVHQAETTWFVYDRGQIALELDADGDLEHRYLWGPAVDQLLADEQIEPGTDGVLGTVDDVHETLWALADHQGTVRDLASIDDGGTPSNAADDTTVVRLRRSYDSYGRLVDATYFDADGLEIVDPADDPDAVEALFGYTGRPMDEATGLQNNLNRWYDPATGRWMSQDPLQFKAGDANLYRYVGNDPANEVDPSGLDYIRVARNGHPLTRDGGYRDYPGCKVEWVIQGAFGWHSRVVEIGETTAREELVSSGYCDQGVEFTLSSWRDKKGAFPVTLNSEFGGKTISLAELEKAAKNVAQITSGQNLTAFSKGWQDDIIRRAILSASTGGNSDYNSEAARWIISHLGAAFYGLPPTTASCSKKNSRLIVGGEGESFRIICPGSVFRAGKGLALRYNQATDRARPKWYHPTVRREATGDPEFSDSPLALRRNSHIDRVPLPYLDRHAKANEVGGNLDNRLDFMTRRLEGFEMATGQPAYVTMRTFKQGDTYYYQMYWEDGSPVHPRGGGFLGESHPEHAPSGYFYLGAEEIVKYWLGFKEFQLPGKTYVEELLEEKLGL